MGNMLETAAAAKVPPPRMLEGDQIGSDLLRDESRMEGKASYATFPQSLDEVSAAMTWASAKGVPVTVSGGRTGIAGGAVPEGGLLLCMSKLQRIGAIQPCGDGNSEICVGAGVLLSELQNTLIVRKSGLIFPPDPTETSATIGGMIACNASGAHTYKYGPTRDYVKGISAVLPGGEMLRLKRGEALADGSGRFTLRKSDGSAIDGAVPIYNMPETKNAAGYYSGAGMDLIDLFIGSEGTLAVIAEADLLLIPQPELLFSALFFMPGEDAAIELIHNLRAMEGVGTVAIEYFDYHSLELLRGRRREMKAASMVPPGMPEGKYVSAVYLDVSTTKAGAAAEAELLLKASSGLSYEKMPMTVWAAFDKDERERLRKFRHALPETVNTLIASRRKTHPKITKLGTDMAVPDDCLSKIMHEYRRTLDKAGLEYVIFGHIGDNHLHVNILPRNPDEYAHGKEIYHGFAQTVLGMNGSISAEHGIGKLKKSFLHMMLGDEGIDQMEKLKAVFDPAMSLGQGTLF